MTRGDAAYSSCRYCVGGLFLLAFALQWFRLLRDFYQSDGALVGQAAFYPRLPEDPHVSEQELSAWGALQSPAVARGFESIAKLPDWLARYVLLHNTSLYAKKRPHYLRYNCLGANLGDCGGTGDRLSGILQAFAMAMCLNRTLLIQWSSPDELKRYLEPNLIAWHWPPRKGGVMSMVKAMDQDNYPQLVDPYLIANTDHLIELSTNVWLGQEQLLAPSSCLSDYLECFQSRPQHLYRELFWTLFRWSPAVLDRVARLRHRLQLYSPYIGVHVRTGLGETFEDLTLPSADEHQWSLYLACAQSLQRGWYQRCNQSANLYLAADNRAVKQTLLQSDPFIKTMVDLPIYHLDRTPRERLSNATAAELDVWAELKVLMDAECLVTTPESRFSRLAAWLPASPRCAVAYNDCKDQQVERALQGVDCSGNNG